LELGRIRDSGGKQMLRNLALLVMATASLIAQTAQGPMGIRQHYKPGDTLRYTVTFDGDPNFDNVSIYFAAGEVPPDQSGLTNSFGVGRAKKAGPGKFDVEGEIPSNAASGTYRLSGVQTRIAPNGAKSYDAAEFHETVEVDNGVRYEFPPLKSIVPK
jgi:hypothetical protein